MTEDRDRLEEIEDGIGEWGSEGISANDGAYLIARVRDAEGTRNYYTCETCVETLAENARLRAEVAELKRDIANEDDRWRAEF